MFVLSYHRRLRMISEALELRVEGGRVSHSCCMGVVCHGYGGLGGGMDGMLAGQIQGDCSHVGIYRSTSRVRGETLMTLDHTAIQVPSS